MTIGVVSECVPSAPSGALELRVGDGRLRIPQRDLGDVIGALVEHVPAGRDVSELLVELEERHGPLRPDYAWEAGCDCSYDDICRFHSSW